MAAYKSFRLPESKENYPPERDFRVKHTSLVLELDFGRSMISGSATVTISPLVDKITRVRLDACELDISKVAIDGERCDFRYDGKKIDVVLKAEMRGEHSVKVEYSASPKEGLYFVGPDKEHPEREVQAWSHNEAEFARYWYPCVDRPSEKASSEITITVPRGFRVVSNGALVSATEDQTTATFHWKEDFPHSSYLTSFVAGKFGEITQEASGVKLHYYFPERKRADVLRYFGETPKMLEVFEELTKVKYPYLKYDQTTVEEFVFGGMENLDATTLAMHYYPDEHSEEDFQTSYATPYSSAVGLVSHELAHQWFGDLVTCADWSHIWLNEAFATYFQALYYEKTRGRDVMVWDLDARAHEYLDEDESEYRRPIVDRGWVYPDDMFDFTTYEKGASMIHELRYLLGDDDFFAGVTEYLQTFSRKNPDTDDLRKIMEKVSGRSLEEFFEQSFRKPGYPEFEVEYAWNEADRTASLRVKQAQLGKGGATLFRLPCDIVFYVDGKRTLNRVWLEAAEQSLVFSLPGKPSIVEVDPQRWLLKKVKFGKSLDLLLNQLSDSVDAWSRAEAANELGRLGSNAAVEGLKAAAAKDQFWNVGQSALRALGEIGTKDALSALIDLALPKNRRVRRGLAGALGAFTDPEARSLLISLLNNDESPYVKCEAALSLAKCWPEGAFPLLVEAMKSNSPNGTLGEACLEAMGRLKDGGIEGVIRSSMEYGNPTRVRIGSLKAIKARGAVLDEEVPLLKDILLNDKEFRVRLYLVNELVRPLGDKRFLEAVRQAADADQDYRVRRKGLEAYHELTRQAEESAAVSKLTAEVHELKEEIKSLKSGAGG